MAHALSLRDSVVVEPGVLFRYVDDETVLLNVDTGLYFGLDAVGTRMWQLIVEHGTLQRVFDAVLEEYAVTPSQLEQDLLTLARELHEKGLIHQA